MISAKQLKASVLHWSIQGKLTDQRESDGNAAELLEKIFSEKIKATTATARSGKRAGKIVVPAKPTPIPPDEIPFQIPKNWTWCRLGDVFKMFTGNSINKAVKDKKYRGNDKGLIYIGTADVSFSNGINYETDVKISDVENFKIAPANSVLLCVEGGSAGRKIGKTDRDVCFGNKLCCFTANNNLESFLFLYLQSSEFSAEFQNSMTGIIGGVKIGKLQSLPFPLPPLAEQKRIVARVEKILAKLEDYAEAEKQLLAADGAFPQAIKKSVLAAAVAGKLTDQRASDGNAAELLEKIFSEKIKATTATARSKKRAGKISVPAKPTPIPPDEIPFQIPKNWTWCRLGDLATFHDGEKKSEKKLPNLDAKFLRGKSCGNVLHSGKFIPAGTTLILVDGENSGEIFSVPVDGYQGSTFKILKIADEVFRDYVELFIKKNHELFRESKKGAAIPHLNRALFQNIPFPLPPLAEQKRIVARVEKILAALLPLSQDAGTVR